MTPLPPIHDPPVLGTGRRAFLEKVFLGRRRPTDALRGVELFNLRLLRELASLGRPVLLFLDSSWRETAESFLADGARPRAPVRIVPVNGGGSGLAAGLLAAVAIRREARRSGPFETLLLGNVANRLVPALRLLRSGRDFRRMVLVAHRETSPRFLRAVRRLPGHVVAVCGQIAAPFRAPDVAATAHVDYGILEADSFHPAETPRPPDAPVRFVVLGALDNAWKGADTALAAFRLLPPDVRSRCELHLAAYADPPAFPDDPGVHAYSWLDPSRMPGLLRSMDAMLLPSRDEGVMRETFSQAAVQGMLTGLPCVYAPLPVLAEKFDRGGGIEADSPERFAAAMARLALDPALRARLGAEARATALARYVWDTGRFCRRYLDETKNHSQETPAAPS